MTWRRKGTATGVTGRDEGAASGRGPGGFRSQPLWLRILLIVSLAALATGVVRCSFEMSARPDPARAGAT